MEAGRWHHKLCPEGELTTLRGGRSLSNWWWEMRPERWFGVKLWNVTEMSRNLGFILLAVVSF